MYLSILLLPLVNFLSLVIFGSFFNYLSIGFTAVTLMGLAVVISFVLLYEVGLCFESCEMTLYNWFIMGDYKLELGLMFDTLTVVMVFIICFISCLVHLYSLGYMETDKHLTSFISYLSFFTFCMLVLVTANNLLQLFIGWEGVGMSSYLLISFWYTRMQANKAALKAMLLNRMGDIFLLMGMILLFMNLGSMDYYMLNNLLFLNNLSGGQLDVVCFCLFLGAMGKSAQLFLHVWLADAMEGPTPVSALMHAATMVTAGIFLVMRCSFMFELSEVSLLFMMFIGSMTAFLMGIVGMFQNDMKKIVAYSTCSQLGYMFFSCGVSNYFAGMFHLFNHAFFKALLFLSMGVMIHAIFDEQDLSKMGNLSKFLPMTFICVFVGNIALLGIPFFTGYYSKDILLELSFVRYNFDGWFSYILGVIAVMFTAFYSTSLFFSVFFFKMEVFSKNMSNMHESALTLLIPLLVLVFFSIFMGFVCFDMFVGLGSQFFNTSIYMKLLNYNLFDVDFGMNSFIKLIPFFLTIMGMLSYIIFFNSFFFHSNKFSAMYLFFFNSLFFDSIYNFFLVKNFLQFSYDFYYKMVEFGFLKSFFILNMYFGMKKFKFVKYISLYFSKLYFFLNFMVMSLMYMSYLYCFSIYFLFFFSIMFVIMFCFLVKPVLGWVLKEDNELVADLGVSLTKEVIFLKD